MRASKWIVVAIFILVASAIAETNNELWIGGGGFVPSEDFWEASRGASLGWRHTKDELSFGLSIGVQSADVSDETLSGVDGFVTSSYQYGLRYAGYVDYYEGDATMVPITGLASWNIPLDKLTLSLEAGLRYVFVNADVTAHMLDGVSYQGYVLDADRWQSDTEIGNNLLGLVGANLKVPLGEHWAIFLNGGYQFDISSSDVEFKTHWTDYDGKSVTKSELGGFYALAGLAYKWSSAPSGKKQYSTTAISTTIQRPVGITTRQDDKSAAIERKLAEEKRQAEIARRAEELIQAENWRNAQELRKAEELIKAEEQRKAAERQQREEFQKQKEQDNSKTENRQVNNAQKGHINSADSNSADEMTAAEMMQSLDKLKALKEDGVMSAEEYESKREELMKYYLGIKQ